MRREHVFKLCANHVITSEMQLKPFPNSARAWLWTTLADFSEETTTAETLAARFKSNDVANQFKEVFENALWTLSCKSDSEASLSMQRIIRTKRLNRKKEKKPVHTIQLLTLRLSLLQSRVHGLALFAW